MHPHTPAACTVAHCGAWRAPGGGGWRCGNPLPNYRLPDVGKGNELQAHSLLALVVKITSCVPILFASFAVDCRYSCTDEICSAECYRLQETTSVYFKIVSHNQAIIFQRRWYIPGNSPKNLDLQQTKDFSFLGFLFDISGRKPTYTHWGRNMIKRCKFCPQSLSLSQ